MTFEAKVCVYCCGTISTSGELGATKELIRGVCSRCQMMAWERRQKPKTDAQLWKASGL